MLDLPIPTKIYSNTSDLRIHGTFSLWTLFSSCLVSVNLPAWCRIYWTPVSCSGLSWESVKKWVSAIFLWEAHKLKCGTYEQKEHTLNVIHSITLGNIQNWNAGWIPSKDPQCELKFAWSWTFGFSYRELSERHILRNSLQRRV